MKKEEEYIPKSKNPSAVIAIWAAILSSVVFPYFIVMADYAGRNFKGINLFTFFYKYLFEYSMNLRLLFIAAFFIYLIAIILYLLNAIGKQKDHFSIFASVLFIISFFIIFIIVRIIKSPPHRYFNWQGTEISLGAYAILIIGIVYLLLHKKINSSYRTRKN